MSECPICGGGISVPRDAVENELIDCVECASELEVTSLSPIRLQEAPLEAEDWGE